MLRRQPPVRSPITTSALLAGVRAMRRQSPEARRQLHAKLRQIYSAEEVLLFDSGTAALTVALAAAARRRPGRPVALPAYCCYDLATAAIGSGVSVALYDLDPATLGPDLASLVQTLALQPAAVVIAHLFGYPVDVERMEAICRQAGALLIEDAAQGAGGALRGVALGAQSALSVLSFGRGKGITAGAGGALLARGAGCALVHDLGAQLEPPGRGAREVAGLALQWLLGRPALYGFPAALPFLRLGETVYRTPTAPGEMSDAAVAMLPSALGSMTSERDRRRANAIRLLAAARRSAKVRSVEPIRGANPGFLRLPVVSETVPAGEVVRDLAARGVARGYPMPLSRLAPLEGRIVNRGQGLAGAELLAERLLTFPTHGLLTETDLHALEGWLC